MGDRTCRTAVVIAAGSPNAGRGKPWHTILIHVDLVGRTDHPGRPFPLRIR
ncbi:hypothetical protein I6A60_38360 [Frankia sp. AgB1.9]|uniref:hypothetical protein n=1 Tax=unclassified Frankia TaxID=2632575 RepID=UPI001932664E|nr:MULTISPECIES: hypothetical protein [unclassified Frankia]MBL7553654.1 hypothetical protein [Frankia sp. AgB1.9]